VSALRELKEETGYSGKVVGRTGQQYLSPGLTNENLVTIYVEVRCALPAGGWWLLWGRCAGGAVAKCKAKRRSLQCIECLVL
jgi:hypothetical protein